MILGSSALRIWPNVDELKFVSTTNPLLFIPGRKLFNTLKASARNSTVWRSRRWNMRDIAASNCQYIGSFIVPRPRFPSVPVAGAPNAAGFNHRSEEHTSELQSRLH